MAGKHRRNDDRTTVREGVTPVGTITFCYLTEPDYKFDKSGTYTVKLRLSVEEAETILAQAHELIDAEFEKAKAECKTKLEVSKLKIAEDLPIKPELDENAEETGNYIFSAKMRASGVTKEGKTWTRRPILFDVAGRAIADETLSIWSGTEARVAYDLCVFSVPTIGIGVSSRLKAVQIITLVTGDNNKSARDYGFEEVDGAYKVLSDEEEDTGETAEAMGDY